ncbi:putative polyprotein [Lampyris noctiluca tymovirus-like virus 1]|nr:putative polyprotein [Lampyris noctiluca tymovirus-like virus 1]
MQNIVETLSQTVHRDTVAGPILESALKNLRFSLDLFPWQLTLSQSTFLNSLGLSTTTFGTAIHPHPLHKCIETHLLSVHWHHLATVPSTVLYMKPAKFRKLSAKNPNFQTLINYRHTPRDVTRYPVSTPSFPTTSVAFMHDALMFVSPSQILDLFVNSPTLDHLYASLIVPAETFHRLPSLHPELYRLEYHGDSVTYFLENNQSSYYVQPFSAVNWLRFTSITSGSFTLSVTVLESWASVHSLLISRHPIAPSPPSLRFFSSPKMICLPQPSNCSTPLSARLVPAEIYHSLFTYVRSVRTLRVTDPTGFVRIHRSKPEHSWVASSAWDALSHLALQTCSRRPFSSFLFFPSSLAAFLNRAGLLLPRVFRASICSLPLFLFSHRLLPPFSFSFRMGSLTNLAPPPHLLLPPHLRILPLAERFENFLLCGNTVPFDTLIYPLPTPTPPTFTISFFFQSPWYQNLFSGIRSLLTSKLFLATATFSYLSYRFWNFSAEHSPQLLSDQYLSFFHHENWNLSLPSSVCTANPTPFLPVPALPLSIPPTAAKPSKFLPSNSHPLSLPPPAPSSSSSPPSPSSSPPLPTPRPRKRNLTLPPTPAPRLNLPLPSQPETHQLSSSSTSPSSSRSSLSPPQTPSTSADPSPSSTPIPPLSSHPRPPLLQHHDADLLSSPYPIAHCVSSDLKLSAGLAVSIRALFPSETWSTPRPFPSVYPLPHATYGFVFNLVTKAKFYQKPTLSDLAFTLNTLRDTLTGLSIFTFSIPYKLSCGLDRLLWEDVLDLLLSTFDHRFTIHVYQLPSADLAKALPLSSPPSENLIFGSSQPFIPPTNSPTSLDNDPSASGPTLPYHTLVPFSMPSSEGTFLSRLRSSPSTLPYPSENVCLFTALSSLLNVPAESLWLTLRDLLPDSLLQNTETSTHGFSSDHLTVLAWNLHFHVRVLSEHGELSFGPPSSTSFILYHSPGHWSATPPLVGAASLPSQKQPFSRLALSFRDSSNNFLPFLQVHSYPYHPLRAKNLASNLKNNSDGVISSLKLTNPKFDPLFFVSLDNRADFPVSRTVPLIHLSGFPGCGKSHPISRLLLTPAFRHKFRVTVPSTELRSEWKQMLKLPSSESWRVSTWETALFKHAPVLVIDEIYKLPNGYLDLCLLADPSILFVIILGDPCQSTYSSLSPTSTNHTLLPETQHLSPYRDLYCFWSHRIPQNIAKLFGVTSFNKNPGFLHQTLTFSNHYPVLVASQADARVLNSNSLRALTFSSSQGSTFSEPVQLFVNSHIKLQHHSVSLVAFTRSRAGVFLTGDVDYLHRTPGVCPIFQSFAKNEPVNFRALFSHELGSTKIITSPLKRRPLLGASPSAPSVSHLPARIDSSYDLDVIFKAPVLFDVAPSVIPSVSTLFLPTTRRPLHNDIPCALPSPDRITPVELTDTAIEPVYPGISYETLASTFLPPTDPESKERSFHGVLSNQFPHLDLPFELGAQPLSLVAPKHDIRSDPLLLSMSLSKRLRFRPSPSPYRFTSSDHLLGHLLFHSLSKAYHRSPTEILPFNPELFLDCINLNEYSQLSNKTQSVIMANAYRSDPDWRYSFVRIFSKTQHKVNENSLFGDWKACQTLALMHDAIILLFGPIKKYQRALDQQSCPPNLFIYGGKTPFDLSTYARENLFSTSHTCNDYTAFDQSQHGEAVILEALKMRRVGIPSFFIDLHIQLKTSITSQFGPLTCMRLTGEPGTYDDNTDYNIAVLYSKFAISNHIVFVSGDDSSISPPPSISPSWTLVQPLLHLRFKQETTSFPLFCGYFLGPAGAIRAPRSLFVKSILALSDRSLPDKIASYLSEFVVGHSLGDSFWSLLPHDQIPYQSALFDFFCRHASKEQKLSLKIGEVPDSLALSLLQSGCAWLSRPLYALLNRQTRLRLLHKNPTLSPPDDPMLEGVLQLHL